MDLDVKIIKAIKKINADAQVTVSVAIDNSWSVEFLHGAAEISKSDIEAKITEVEKEEKDTIETATTKKASGKAKLKELGLDDAEIKALIGA